MNGVAILTPSRQIHDFIFRDEASCDGLTHLSDTTSQRAPFPGNPGDAIECMKRILKARDLTLNQISKATALPPFDRDRHYFIHHGFYDQLKEGQEPHLFQLAALSEITGLHLKDWMLEFGYDLDDILRFQLALHISRTIVVSSSTYEGTLAALSSDFHAVQWPAGTQRLATVGRVITRPHIRMTACDTASRYLYVKAGADDCLMPSHVPAGCLVRVDPRRTGIARHSDRPIYAVEHLYGVSLCYVEALGSRGIRLVSYNSLPWLAEFDLESQAVVLGTVDRAIVPLREEPDAVTLRFPTKSRPQPLVSVLSTDGPLHGFVQASRQRVGLTFQEAEELSLKIVDARDRRYAVVQGTLSDYEALDLVPRHVPKIITLCSIYAMDFWHYARIAGLRTGALHGHRIPWQTASSQAEQGGGRDCERRPIRPAGLASD